MSERPFNPAPFGDRRYGELRCRRYLFEPLPEPQPAPASAEPAAAGRPQAACAPEGWTGVRRPQ